MATMVSMPRWALMLLAQGPKVQKKWPSAYDEPKGEIPEADPGIVQAYDEVQGLLDKLGQFDAEINEIQKKAKAEIVQYKIEHNYEQVTKDVDTKWKTIKRLVSSVQGKVVKLGHRLLAVIEKKERSSWPNPTKFKEALVAALPELDAKINDIWEKARSYEDISKFFEVTEPSKELLEQREKAAALETEPLDDVIDGLVDMHGLLGKLDALLVTDSVA